MRADKCPICSEVFEVIEKISWRPNVNRIAGDSKLDWMDECLSQSDCDRHKLAKGIVWSDSLLKSSMENKTLIIWIKNDMFESYGSNG